MSMQLTEQQGIHLAVEGCAHGELNTIYASVAEACKQKGWPSVDLLICCGDFQSVRNAYDLNCVSMPAKYREMCDFHEYYSLKRKAPYLTVFVGGNHEASNYLFELYYGGWVAPNIYYLGASNVIRLGPLRIAGMGGIWKGYNYRKPHHERLPYDDNDLRSIYHTRELDVRKLLQIRTQVDIGISHDWPRGVEWAGNSHSLFRTKKHLQEDAENNQLGSPAAKQVLDRLRPRMWFSAHLHVKYAAEVDHDGKKATNGSAPSNVGNDDEIKLRGDLQNGMANSKPLANADEIDLDLLDDDQAPPQNPVDKLPTTNADEIDLELEDDENGTAPVASGQGLDGVQLPIESNGTTDGVTYSVEEARAALPEAFRRNNPPKPKPAVHPPDITSTTTKFLALDKVLPGRPFLQLLDLPVSNDEDIDSMRPLNLTYDREWLAITRSFALSEPIIVGDATAGVPRWPADPDGVYSEAIDKCRQWIDEKLSDGDLVIPEDFVQTAPVFDGGNFRMPQYSAVTEYPNPQTERFCKMLDIPNPFAMSDAQLRAAEEVREHGTPTVPLPGAESNRGGHGGGRGRGGGRGHGFGRGRGGRGRGQSRGRGRGRFATG